MDWISMYAIFWMCLCAFETGHLIRLKTAVDERKDNEYSGENIVHLLSELKGSLSAEGIMRMTYALCFLHIIFDIAGFLSVYVYTPLRTAEIIVFIFSVIAALYDHIFSLRFTAGCFQRTVYSYKPAAVLIRYLDRFKPVINWMNFAAVYGKIIASLYGVLWICIG